MGNGIDMATLRDYGKRVGVKVVGKKAEDALRAVMVGIKEAAEKAKATNDAEWVKGNRDLIDWFNTHVDEVEDPGAQEPAEGAKEAAPKPAAKKAPAAKGAGKKDPLADAKAKAAAAKAKAAEEKGKKASSKKGGGTGKPKADRKAQFEDKDFRNASHQLTYLFGQGTTQSAAVKALMKRWPDLVRCSTEPAAAALFKVHIKNLGKEGFKVVEKDGVFKVAA